jgi:hypothetical protein
VYLAGAQSGFKKRLAPLPPRVTFVVRPSKTTGHPSVFVTSRSGSD